MVSKLTDYTTDLGPITTGLTTYAKEVVETGLRTDVKHNMSNAELSNVANDINTAMIKGGREAVDTITQFYNKAGNKAGELATTLDGVDWQTVTVTKLKNTLLDVGIAVNYTDEEF
jgi:hypothetical protein